MKHFGFFTAGRVEKGMRDELHDYHPGGGEDRLC